MEEEQKGEKGDGCGGGCGGRGDLGESPERGLRLVPAYLPSWLLNWADDVNGLRRPIRGTSSTQPRGVFCGVKRWYTCRFVASLQQG
mgnify:CR=1 FL=1